VDYRRSLLGFKLFSPDDHTANEIARCNWVSDGKNSATKRYRTLQKLARRLANVALLWFGERCVNYCAIPAGFISHSDNTHAFFAFD
jgi:hypothetical protein